MLTIQEDILNIVDDQCCLGFIRRELATQYEARITYQIVRGQLDRLEAEGLVKETEHGNGKATEYRLTARGRQQVETRREVFT